jgi:hypothetical protein
MRVLTTVAAGVLAAALSFPMAGVALAQDLNCPDFPTQAAAQAVFNADPRDPNNLDRDRDGIACETRPGGVMGSGEDEMPGDGGSTTGDHDRGSAPRGGVEAGAGGTAGSGSELLLALAATGGAALAAGGLVLVRRGPARQGS